MRNLKRVLSLALALVMVLGMMVIGTSAATYTDADEITYKEAVEVMSAIGILTGDAGKFNPKGTLTREGAAKIIAYVCLGEDAENYLTGSAAPFDDVKADRWSAKYVAYCKNLGIIDGVTPTTFNPKGNISVVGFAKLLLGAIEVEGTYTGAGWEENVKKAVASVPTMAATGIKMTNANITREEACELALAAMKAGETYSNGWYIEGYEEEFGYCATYAEAYIMAKAMEVANPEITKHSDVRDSLLKDTYKVTFDPAATDDFGRPGVSYSWTEGTTPVKMFYGMDAFKTYKVGFDADEVEALEEAEYTFTGTKIMINGVEAHAGDGITSIDDVAVRDYVSTDVELYNTDTDKNIEVVVIVTSYLAQVTDIKTDGEADENFVELTVYNPYAANDVSVITYNADDQAEKATYKALAAAVAEEDYLIVNYKGGDTATPKALIDFAAAESKVVTLTARKLGDSFRGTIGTADETFTLASNYVEHADAGAEVSLGEEYTLYFDANGYVIGAVAVEDEDEDEDEVYYYGIVLDADASEYVAAYSGDLLTAATEAKDAKELVKLFNAKGEVEILSTAWTYTKVNGVVTATNFINGSWSGAADSRVYTADCTAGELVVYTLDENGKIDFIDEVGSVSRNGGALVAGKAEVVKGTDEVFGNILTDKTIVFLETTNRAGQTVYKVYEGYKNVPNATFEGPMYYAAANGNFVVALLESATLTVEEVEGDDHLVYFADVTYTEKWDATADDGEGAVVYVYENVYVDGVKTAMTFEEVQSDAQAGALYAYNTEDGFVFDNLLTTKAITLIQSGFFRATDIGVVYVNENTQYVKVTNTGLVAAEALPALSTTGAYTVNVKCVIDSTVPNVDAAAIVYFSVVVPQG